ncbi:MAG: hypothetical protein PHC51_12445 [bacterium]|nr:hypothetical protein [bacterium]
MFAKFRTLPAPVRQLLIFILLLPVGMLLFFPYSSLSSEAANIFVNVARSANITLQLTSPDLKTPFSFKSGTCQGLINNANLPIPFFLEECSLEIPLTKLLLMQVEGTFHANAYNGNVAATVEKGIFSPPLYTHFKFSNVDVALYPLARLYQLSGQLHLNTTEKLKFSPKDGLLAGQIKLTANNISHLGGVNINPFFQTPEVRNGQISIDIKIVGPQILTKNFIFSSSLGEISGNGKFIVTKEGYLKEGKARLQVKLSAEGAKKFSPLLSLASQTQLPGAVNWLMTISWHGRDIPVVTSTPLS